MCNRFHQSEKVVHHLAECGVIVDVDITDRPRQIFPTGKKTPRFGLVVKRQSAGNQPLVAAMQEWGFPTTIKGAKGQPLQKYVTNARNLDSSFWRASLTNPEQRCLVPFTHFAEPHPDGGKGDDGMPKQAWFSLPDQPVAMFAGLWRQTERGPAFAFATCEPNAIVGPIHPKAMPAILTPAEWLDWLSADAGTAKALVRPYDGPMAMQVETPFLPGESAQDARPALLL
ncbi:SOS response-associated peptidase family protein [Sphingomonas sp.]|jgi:putative SOS response-associated peptidase YedK|uniref:SOS response-associated peptidase family protein n=1 Tax=Sphingomonas sp. TaxID=28214 RepID=UPI002E13D0F7|nr:SOS response-associated peptidase family protein [Sphingomonas sp.]HEV7290445.1 SOS response-associated peptidase family protein [Sphingomonas sp.]